MSWPMFLYGFTAGSIIPLAVVYYIRPESLLNLVDFLSSSLLIAFNWSDGVAKRFNLSLDLFSSNTSTIKQYSCYTIEHWYSLFSYLIYFCLIFSILLIVYKQRLKTFLWNENSSIDWLFYYFCILIFALISIFIRIFIEYYLLGYLKLSTMIYLFWFLISYALVCLTN